MFVMNMHHARNYFLCEMLKCGNDVAFFVIIPGKLNIIGYVLVERMCRNGSLIGLFINLCFNDVQSNYKWCKNLKMYAWGSTFFLHDTAAPGGPGPPHYRGFIIILRHTTMCRTPLDEWSTRRRNIYLTTQKQQSSMSPAGFEPTNQASEWPQTNAFSALYPLSQTERFYCVMSNLTEKLSQLRSFDKQ
jgi:hypothetical protein